MGLLDTGVPTTGLPDTGAAPPTPRGGGLGAALFPAPEAENFLDPGALGRLRSLAMMRMGLGMLAGSRGPQGTLNPGAAIGTALDQGQSTFNDALQRVMQQKQWEMQYGGYQVLQQALQKFPAKENESPVEAYQRYSQAADWVAQNAPGPVGLELAGKLTQLAKGFKDNMPDTEKIENVPGDPNGPYAGQNVIQQRDKRTGRVLWEMPYRVQMNAEELGRMELELHNSFNSTMGPMNTGAVAARHYNELGNSPEADNLRLQYARAIFSAHGGGQVDPQQGHLLDQLEEMLHAAPHQLSDASRAQLDAQVRLAIPSMARMANAEYNWTTGRLKSYGLPTDNYVNLWSDYDPDTDTWKGPKAASSPVRRGGHYTAIVRGTGSQ